MWGMVEIELDDYEKEVVRFLAARFDKGEKYISEKGFPRYEEVSEDAVWATVKRFVNFRWLYWEEVEDRFSVRRNRKQLCISDRICEVAHLLDNPPPKNYWKRTCAWFFGRRWSVPVMILTVVLPAILGWIVMLKEILRWVRAGE